MIMRLKTFSIPMKKRMTGRLFLFLLGLLLSGRLSAGTAPVIGLTTFNNAFSATTNLLASVPSPGSVANVGNTGETTGILATGWDFSITAPTGNVSMSASAAGENPGGASDYCIRMNSLSGITVQTTSVKSDDASAFSLQYVYLKLNITAGAPANMTITGYFNGTAVSGAVMTVTGIAGSTWTQINVSAVTAFQNINEFRFTQAVSTSATITFEVVDQIDIAAAIPLPLTLTNFLGQRSGNDVLLKWTTVSEQNTSQFEVERGTDGNTYATVGQVAAAGNSVLPMYYSFTDVLPVSPADAWFYRLKMTDLDGQFTYSPILVVSAAAPGGSSVGVYPNPFRQELSIAIQSPGPDKANIFITDESGKTLLTTTLILQQGSNLLPLPVTGGWPAGLYVLTLSTSRVRQSLKILKSQ